MKIKYILVIIGMVTLMACQTTPEPPKHMSSYDAGYHMGCKSGLTYDVRWIQKDYQRAMEDRGYAHGWDNGFTNCRYNIYRERH